MKELQVLLVGSDGQLGYELQRSLPNDYGLMAVDRDRLDITNKQQIRDFLAENTPDVIVNAAAYTAVDKAEEEKELAWKINHQGAENLATVALAHKLKMVHISTDFIFSDAQATPYKTSDEAKPVSVYGDSKKAGEGVVLSILGTDALVIRTSWLYSAHGNNFVKTMLKMMQQRNELSIIADQVGTPTWAATLADCIWKLIDKEAHGIYHCADNGVASWYDFAVAIQEEGISKGLLGKSIPIKAITTSDYPTPAIRPAYSLMDKTVTEKLLNETLPHWRVSLRNMLDELAQ